MNSISLAEIVSQFRQAALSEGVQLPEYLIADGQGHRFKIDGKLNGYYNLHVDGRPNGLFQNWALHSEPLKWLYQSEFKEFSPEERKAFALERERAHRQRQADLDRQHTEAAQRAQSLWRKARAADSDHTYLVKKRIQPHLARQINNRLVIPLYNEQLQLRNIQFIDETGQKRFLKGGAKAACFCWLGRKKTDPVMIAEGYATACSLYENTGFQSYTAFDAGNLAKVAAIVRRHRPAVQIIVAGDNDLSGKGQQAANDAAFEINGLVSIPPEAGTDWNDFYASSLSKGGGHG